MTKDSDDLTEYVSRPVRKDLVRGLAERFGSLRRLARTLGVSAKAVRNWVGQNGGHPSNPHLQRILVLSLKTDRRGTIALLKCDLRRHQVSVRRFLEGLRGRSGG